MTVRWVPVAETVPSDDEEVLVTIRNRTGALEVTPGFCADYGVGETGDRRWYRSRYGGDPVYEPEVVVAWMALPPPYLSS